jgi:hypothetical protein
MQVVSAAVRASSPATGSVGSGAVTAWPTPLKFEPSTRSTVPGSGSSASAVVAPGITAARVLASAWSPAA